MGFIIIQVKESKKERKWTLRKLDAADGGMAGMTTTEQAAYEADYEHFLQELEDDKEMRAKLNLYKRTDMKPKRVEDANMMEQDGKLLIQKHSYTYYIHILINILFILLCISK